MQTQLKSGLRRGRQERTSYGGRGRSGEPCGDEARTAAAWHRCSDAWSHQQWRGVGRGTLPGASRGSTALGHLMGGFWLQNWGD